VRERLITRRVGIGIAGATDAGVVHGRVARRRLLLEIDLAEARGDGRLELGFGGGVRDGTAIGVRHIALYTAVGALLLALDVRLGEAGDELGLLLADIRALNLKRATRREQYTVRHPDAQGECHANHPCRPSEAQTRSRHEESPSVFGCSIRIP